MCLSLAVHTETTPTCCLLKRGGQSEESWESGVPLKDKNLKQLASESALTQGLHRGPVWSKKKDLSYELLHSSPRMKMLCWNWQNIKYKSFPVDIHGVCSVHFLSWWIQTFASVFSLYTLYIDYSEYSKKEAAIFGKIIKYLKILK